MDQVAGLLNWDQDTQMPPKGAAQRAEQASAVAAAAHALATDPRMADWVAAAEPRDEAGRVNVAEATRIHSRATRIPPRLATELARMSSEGQTAWQAARAASDFAAFAPVLTRIVGLKREEAACLSVEGRTGYDALLDGYEAGATAVGLAGLFGALRPGLVSLRGRIAESGRRAPRFEGTFPRAAQLALSRRLGDVFGYDWEAGRIDLAAHPSSSGSGGDVRITTRINEADPRECAFSTVHEIGHAVYEQGLDPAQAMLPAGSSASMGVHESQSRLFENQLGRSRAFCEWLWPVMAETFGETGLDGPDAIYAAVNAVETGFIRTEADEVHYNLHVMLRFDLERALIGGELEAEGLEEAWNARFLADFGVPVPDARRGVLQDVHWSVGLFGYFPTYSLGNVYAGALHAALRRDLPGLDGALAAGELGPALGWLGERVHRRGRLRPPRVLIAEACGAEPEAGALLAYLEAKYGELYGV